MKEDFKVQVIVNNSLATVLADTGASISVCGKAEAKRWNLLSRMVKTQAKIKPYNSPPIPISGTTKCAVTFGNSSIPVEWHIIDNPCEPVLAGRIAEELGIIKFDAKPTVFQPVQMIHSTDNKETLQNILQQFPQNFEGLGKLKNHQVKLHVDTSLLRSLFAGPRFSPHVQAAYCSNTFHSNCLANHSLSTKIRNSFALKIY